MKRLTLFYLHTSAAIASLVSLGAMLMMDRWQATLALTTIIFFLVALLGIVYAALTGHMRTRYPDGYSRISTFARYTSDGKVVRYEAYRTIQCRQPVMSAFLHGYKWTGSRPSRQACRRWARTATAARATTTAWSWPFSGP